MPDREKVITALEKALSASKAVDSGFIWLTVGKGRKALELLKPVKPIRLNHTRHYQTDNYRCGICGDDMYYEQHFCESCGTEAKWDD